MKDISTQFSYNFILFLHSYIMDPNSTEKSDLPEGTQPAAGSNGGLLMKGAFDATNMRKDVEEGEISDSGKAGEGISSKTTATPRDPRTLGSKKGTITDFFSGYRIPKKSAKAKSGRIAIPKPVGKSWADMAEVKTPTQAKTSTPTKRKAEESMLITFEDSPPTLNASFLDQQNPRKKVKTVEENLRQKSEADRVLSEFQQDLDDIVTSTVGQPRASTSATPDEASNENVSNPIDSDHLSNSSSTNSTVNDNQTQRNRPTCLTCLDQHDFRFGVSATSADETFWNFCNNICSSNDQMLLSLNSGTDMYTKSKNMSNLQNSNHVKDGKHGPPSMVDGMSAMSADETILNLSNTFCSSNDQRLLNLNSSKNVYTKSKNMSNLQNSNHVEDGNQVRHLP